MAGVGELPDEVLEAIFSLLDFGDLTQCLLVCRRWSVILMRSRFWWKLCLPYLPDSLRQCKPGDPVSWMHIYRGLGKRPLYRNLIKNSCGAEGLAHWEVCCGSFECENPPCGAEPVPKDISDGYDDVSVWATSYMCCEKYQVINLEDEGAHPQLIDTFRPPIFISEYYAARFDCASEYRLLVELLGLERTVDSSAGNKVDSLVPIKESEEVPNAFSNLRRRRMPFNICHHDADYIHPKNDKPPGGHRFVVLSSFQIEEAPISFTGIDWHRAQHIFRDYPTGVRYVRFSHYGKDKQFWAGSYGSKFTKSTVRFL